MAALLQPPSLTRAESVDFTLALSEDFDMKEFMVCTNTFSDEAVSTAGQVGGTHF
jgi:hypothetical protein